MCLFFSSSQVGSPSALSDPGLNQKLHQAAQQYGRTLYIPSGALWGGQDIQRLNDSGALKVHSHWGSAGVAITKGMSWFTSVSSLDLFSGFVYKNVQASILLPADRRRPL